MPGYKIDFEYAQFGDVVLNAEDADTAAELAIEQVAEVHGIDPSEITITTVTELNASTVTS